MGCVASTDAARSSSAATSYRFAARCPPRLFAPILRRRTYPRPRANWRVGSTAFSTWTTGVSPRDAGIGRLAEWIGSRLERNPREHISGREILARAREWMPDCFAGFEVDLRNVRTWRRTQRVPWDGQSDEADEAEDERVGEALDCLDAPKVQRRMRGLRLLSDMEHPDLFEWCAMMLEDPQIEVRIAACKAMRQCPEIEVEVVEHHGHSEDKRLRAAAVEVMAMRGETGSRLVLARLDRSENHVRLSVAKHLERIGHGNTATFLKPCCTIRIHILPRWRAV